jgi:hypothetical protein
VAEPGEREKRNTYLTAQAAKLTVTQIRKAQAKLLDARKPEATLHGRNSFGDRQGDHQRAVRAIP